MLIPTIKGSWESSANSPLPAPHFQAMATGHLAFVFDDSLEPFGT